MDQQRGNGHAVDPGATARGVTADVRTAAILYDLQALSTRERGGVKEALRDAMVQFDDEGLQIHVASRNADLAEAVIGALADVEG